jgi:hypothetical protein
MAASCSDPRRPVDIGCRAHELPDIALPGPEPGDAPNPGPSRPVSAAPLRRLRRAAAVGGGRGRSGLGGLPQRAGRLARSARLRPQLCVPPGRRVRPLRALLAGRPLRAPCAGGSSRLGGEPAGFRPRARSVLAPGPGGRVRSGDPHLLQAGPSRPERHRSRLRRERRRPGRPDARPPRHRAAVRAGTRRRLQPREPRLPRGRRAGPPPDAPLLRAESRPQPRRGPAAQSERRARQAGFQAQES